MDSEELNELLFRVTAAHMMAHQHQSEFGHAIEELSQYVDSEEHSDDVLNAITQLRSNYEAMEHTSAEYMDALSQWIDFLQGLIE